ncbi:cyanate lyase C-terminal domain-containing protein [Melanogaster broomeanus]|nr:cyanate lyase C-terminal domain-containing protein [Melanogaster broomeanus]
MSQVAAVPANNQPYADLPPIITAMFEAKARKGLSFEDLAKAIGRDEVWVAAVFYGQAKMDPADLEKLAGVLEIPTATIQSELGSHWWPNRGLGPMPPTDPVLYRLYESVLVYGHAIKAVIHEKFGDGIMSMIDCKVNVTRKPDPKGDRVVLTFDGKFLSYSKW